ncbi:CueP family metal-binding protein [Leucobacter chromiiresistens]
MAAVIEQFGLPGDDVVEVIDRLDELPLDERPSELLASVRSDELVLAGGGREASLPMPADLTYVSLAPYVTETHECFFHSLTTCLGEMGDERIDVTISDAATGEVVVNETATTYANGFIGYWLPRDREHVVTVRQGGLAGETRFSTASDGPTCITDLRLT